MAPRQVANGTALLAADTAGDELGDDALLVDDAQGRVLGAHQLANAVDNQLQHLLDLEHAAEAAHRGVERLQRRGEQGSLGHNLGIALHRPRLAR